MSIPTATTLPLAHLFYRPILRAAAEMALVIALHFRQPGPNAPDITPVGMPFNYMDYHTLVSLPFSLFTFRFSLFAPLFFSQ